MVQKHVIISMIAPLAVAGILIMTILAATANAQQPVAGCGPGTDNSTCSAPNPEHLPTCTSLCYSDCRCPGVSVWNGNATS